MKKRSVRGLMAKNSTQATMLHAGEKADGKTLQGRRSRAIVICDEVCGLQMS